VTIPDGHYKGSQFSQSLEFSHFQLYNITTFLHSKAWKLSSEKLKSRLPSAATAYGALPAPRPTPPEASQSYV
jgi:hypothetical protein